MRAEATKLAGCYILYPQVFNDARGYFYESYNKQKFDQLVGADVNFVQDNQSYSGYGTIRGLHFQKGAYAQAKLVRVLKGKVLDVAVDLRPDAITFGQWIAVVLDDQLNNQLFIPRGFAHGFSVLSEEAVFAYKCDNFYSKENEGGILYNDATLNIDWQIPAAKQQLSDKDLALGSFQELHF
jgi:dTDP-4-dehydrorhamnose 3,5-epimerase